MDAPTEERLTTRAKNKDQHPGQVTFSGRAKRRTRTEIEEENRLQEEKKKDVEMKKNAVVKRIAQLEDSMAIQDKTVGRAHPRTRKDMHMEEGDHAVSIPSDDSIPPQPKKKKSKGGRVKPAPPQGSKRRKGIETISAEDPDQSNDADEAPQVRYKCNNRQIGSSQWEPALNKSDDERTAPLDSDNGENSPPGQRRLKRSNAIGLIVPLARKGYDEDDFEPEVAGGSEPAPESVDLKIKLKPTRPKLRELIKAASETKEQGYDFEDMDVCEPEVQVDTTTAPNTSNPFNKIKKWTSNVAKTSHSTGTSKSVYVPSVKSSSLTASVPSKRTTSTSSAIVAVKTQPEKKKIKLDNHDSESTTSRFLEDETVEREAALISPIKGKQRLNSNTIVKVDSISPPPKRSGANRKFTNADLPNGAMNGNIWRKKVIPTYIQYLAGQDVKETWTIEDKDSAMLLQTIWNFVYGAEVTNTIRVNGPAFSIADQRICEWRAGIGSTALAIIKAFFEDNHDEFDTDAACQTFATRALIDYGFLYGSIEEKNGKTKRKNIFCGPLVIQTFTSHLNATRGAQVVTTLGPPGNATVALALSAAAVERVLKFWRDGQITLQSIGDDKKGKGGNGIRRAINEYTGKGSKTTDFNHTNWRMATNAYLASIKANIMNGKLIWKDVIGAALEFTKLNVNEGSMTALGGDVEDERALLVPDSDSDS